jgi:hypothetical protein
MGKQNFVHGRYTWQLWSKKFAVPRLKSELPRKAKLFQYKWVDEIKRGVSQQVQCADVKRKYGPEKLEDE